MKKLLFFLFLLFIPFMVNAEVKITDISFEESNFLTEDDDLPTYEGLSINLDLEFKEIEDYVVYNVVLENDTEKDYDIDESTTISAGNYIKYELYFPESVKTIKSGEELEFQFVVYYDKEVPSSKFINGIYTESQALTINLVNDDEVATENQTTNPNTNVSGYIIFAVIILIIALALLIFNYRKLAGLMIISLGIIIPMTIYAIEKISIDIKTNVRITEKYQFYVVDEIPRRGINEFPTYTYEFEPNMTFGEWFETDYNYNSIYIDDITQATYCDAIGQVYLYQDIEHDYGWSREYYTSADSIMPNETYRMAKTEACITG